ncbi:hypothetical protein E4T56_gene4497 [Termitomyces sp. T112]|nr:hypothetical protein E4T56_gene4497 [Termitomyces sp. T112]
MYNNCMHNEVLVSLSSFLSSSLHLACPSPEDHMIWLGDFNWHHPLWELPCNWHLNSLREFIQPLLDLLADHAMELALPLGISTLQTTADSWTRLDNVWKMHSDTDPIISCDVDASLWPSLADHLLVITKVELPVLRSSALPSRDFHLANWEAFNNALKECLTAHSPAQLILTEDEFHTKVNDLTEIIQEVIATDDVIPLYFACDQVPDLKVEVNGMPTIASSNAEKATALAESFFPPPPLSTPIPHSAYPKPLADTPYFTREHIASAIGGLPPLKAPGPDSIPNIVLKRCAKALLDYLYFIFELNVYYLSWLESTTLVLHKPGKPVYNVAKAYKPIGLPNTIGKLLSTLVAANLSHIAKHQEMLLPGQFGSCLG